jgi:hypothetical protein
MSTPPKAAAEQQPPSSGRRWLPGLSVGQAAALVGLIGSIIGLVFIFKPGWKPSPPQDRGMVEIGETRVRQPVTFKRYLQRLKLPPGTLSSGMLRRRGVMIEFHAHIVGLRGKELPIRWELNNAATEDLGRPSRSLEVPTTSRSRSTSRRRAASTFRSRISTRPLFAASPHSLSISASSYHCEFEDRVSRVGLGQVADPDLVAAAVQRRGHDAPLERGRVEALIAEVTWAAPLTLAATFRYANRTCLL